MTGHTKQQVRHDHKVYCIIPARGGSVRIPRKNVKAFKGKPMLAYPVHAAKESGLFDDIIVSTDDDEIEAIAQALEVTVHRRPADNGKTGTQELAAQILEPLMPPPPPNPKPHLWKKLGALLKDGRFVGKPRYDYSDDDTQPYMADEIFACVLYPCAPLLHARDLVHGWQQFMAHTHAYAVSHTLDEGVHTDAGCYYFGRAQSFVDRVPLTPTNTLPVRVQADRFIDINTPEDWAHAEKLHEALYGAT